MSIRKTSVAIDGELLATVQAALGTRTIRETINQALLETLRAKARREEVEAMASMDGMELDDPEIMNGTWRQ